MTLVKALTIVRKCDLKCFSTFDLFLFFSFQIVLMAPTSAAVKLHEEPLTYMNQAQSYEIKFKKLGDSMQYTGKCYRVK